MPNIPNIQSLSALRLNNFVGADGKTSKPDIAALNRWADEVGTVVLAALRKSSATARHLTGSLSLGSIGSSFTEGSVIFVAPGGTLTEDNTNFNYVDSSDTLNVGGDLRVDNKVATNVGSGATALTLAVSSSNDVDTDCVPTAAGTTMMIVGSTALEVTGDIATTGDGDDYIGTAANPFQQIFVNEITAGATAGNQLIANNTVYIVDGLSIGADVNSTNKLYLGSLWTFEWDNGLGTADIVLSRASANVLQLATGDSFIPQTSGQDLGATGNRWDVFGAAGDFSGTLEAATLTEGGNAVPNATDGLDFFAATTSAEFFGVISDETGGSGVVVGSANPTLAGATINGGDLTLSDGVGDSPKLTLTPATGTSFSVFVADTDDDLRIEANTASTERIEIENVGAGVIDVDVDGTLNAATLTEGGNAVPNSTDKLDFFAATTSAELAGVISDETGSSGGVLVFNNAPSITSPTIGTSATLSFLTEGSVPFAGAGGAISQDNSNFFWDASNVRLTLGTNSFAETTEPALVVHKTQTDTSGTRFGGHHEISAAPASASTALYHALFAESEVASANAQNLTSTSDALAAITAQVAHRGTGTIATTATIRVVGGLTSTGTITRYRGIHIANPVNAGGGTLTNNTALNIADQTAGGTTNFAIQTGTGLVDFGDVVNSATGYRIASAAASGNVLRGNGTNFVSAQLAFSDLSGSATLAQLPFGTANQLLKTNTGGTAQEHATLAAGTSGTDFAVAFGVGTITLDLPDAGASARGAVTTGTQTLAGAKTFSSAPTFSSLTEGSVVFLGSGGLVSQNNADFFWNNTVESLQIGPRSSYGTTAQSYWDSGLNIFGRQKTATSDVVLLSVVSQDTTTEEQDALGAFTGMAHTSGTKADVFAVFSDVVQTGNGGTTTDARCFSASMEAQTGGTITNGYGLQVQSATEVSTGSIGTFYGVKVENQTVAGTNYAIHTGTGIVQLGSTLTLNGTAITPGTAVVVAPAWEPGYGAQTGDMIQVGGWITTGSANGGTVTQTRQRVILLQTSTTVNGVAIAASTNELGLSVGKDRLILNWSKRIRLSMQLTVSNISTNSVTRLYLGKNSTTAGDVADKAIGLRINTGRALIGHVHDGTSLDTVDLSTTISGDSIIANVEIVSDGAGNVEWFVNGVSKGTSTGGPTGDSASSANKFHAEVDNGGDASNASLRVHSWLYWIAQ